jgi:hypothetical protein
VITTAIKQGMIVHTGSDDVSLPQITETILSWYRHPEFDPELPVLWDLRTIDLTLSRAQLPETDLSEWSSQMLPITNAARAGRKTAWVFGSAEVAEFAVDLLSASDWQHKVRIFNDDIEAAVSWLTSTIR